MEQGFHNTAAITLERLLKKVEDFMTFAKSDTNNEAEQLLVITEDMAASYDLIHALEKYFEEKAAVDPEMLYYPIVGITDHEYKLVGDCGDGNVILSVDGNRAFYPKDVAEKLMSRSPTWLVDEMNKALEGKQYGVALYTSELYPNPHHLQPLSTSFASRLNHWVVIGVMANDHENYGEIFHRLRQPMTFTVQSVK